ncbi:hexose transporter [Cylindrobasidium torrendii FP15055 ss-10]|uniref:Hexose transporter n=1 Tax=Cylindrobasidium torrendii FP15055 ss-10 TaxID=1314674 RepID=A0A0D7BF87_9AGAR|nr:hexose transporter [Cylindrobasidium torrendii FP15055 ss-10]
MAGGPISNGVDYTAFLDPSKKWYNNTRLALLTFYCIILLLGSSTLGYNELGSSALQSITYWHIYFNFPSPARIGWMISMINVGLFVSTVFASPICDRIGRRWTILIGNLFVIIGSAVQASSQNVGMFMGARVIAGAGSGWMTTASPILISEIAYPSYRPMLASAYLPCMYFGAILASWITFGTSYISNDWAWRIPSACQAITPLMQMVMIFFVPESPRWLVMNGREEEALAILAYYHADGNTEDPLITHEMDEIKRAVEFEALNPTSYLSLFTTWRMIRRLLRVCLIIILFQWTGVTLAAFYLSVILFQVGVTNVRTQLIISAMLSTSNLFFGIIGAKLSGRFSRRSMFMSSLTAVMLFVILETVTYAVYSYTGTQAAGYAFVVFVFLGFAALNVGYAPIAFTYIIEIFPLATRSKAFNIAHGILGITLIFNAEVNPIALDAIGWKYFLVYIVVCALGIVGVYFFIKETWGLTLEEAGVVYDNIAASTDSGSDIKDSRTESRAVGQDDKTHPTVDDKTVVGESRSRRFWRRKPLQVDSKAEEAGIFDEPEINARGAQSTVNAA